MIKSESGKAALEATLVFLLVLVR